ncbi:hypothetical protein GCM10011365_14510 [Marinicella pacifica]|uniref:Uncharacterized protein n=1 Tax=Marinicella pacifica TaxID=1171543 RepID=A0A917CN55_9GAMM|nr:hypothetical protein GCM10011365_14510 [Marinicella pacifica]
MQNKPYVKHTQNHGHNFSIKFNSEAGFLLNTSEKITPNKILIINPQINKTIFLLPDDLNLKQATILSNNTLKNVSKEQITNTASNA